MQSPGLWKPSQADIFSHTGTSLSQTPRIVKLLGMIGYMAREILVNARIMHNETLKTSFEFPITLIQLAIHQCHRNGAPYEI